MLRDFIRCPQLAYNRHVLRRAPDRRSTALDVGTLFHEAMQFHLAGFPLELDQLPSWFECSPDGRTKFLHHQLPTVISQFTLPTHWEIIGTEIPLTHRDFQGRLDVLIKLNGRFWSLQWKTFDDGLLMLQERVRLSYHEAAYQWLAEANGYTPWGGTILGACQKLPQYRMIPGEDGHRHREDITIAQRVEAFTLHYLARSEEKQNEIIENLMLTRRDADREFVGPPIRRNYDQCFGIFGRGRCDYFSVCHDGANIEQFIQIEDRYADITH